MIHGPIDHSGNVHDENGRFVSLRDYIETIIEEREKQILLRDQAHKTEHILIDKALDKAQNLREEAVRQARVVVDQRLEKLNELRQEVTEDRANYVTRGVYEADRKFQNIETEAFRVFRTRATIFVLIAVPFAGAIGAAVLKALS